MRQALVGIGLLNLFLASCSLSMPETIVGLAESVDRGEAFAACQAAANLTAGLPTVPIVPPRTIDEIAGENSNSISAFSEPPSAERLAQDAARDARSVELQRRISEMRVAAVASGDSMLERAARSGGDLDDVAARVLRVCVAEGYW